MTKRLFLAGIMQETNRFSPIPLDDAGFTLQSWDPAILPVPPESVDLLGYGAVYSSAGDYGFDVVPSLFASATPAMPIAVAEWHKMRDRVIADLRAALPIDAVFLFLHGAMSAQGEDDCEGDLIAAVRSVVGPSVPIAAQYDLHGNVSRRMVEEADFTLSCLLYPHIDHPQRSLKAASLLARACSGEISQQTTALKLPLVGLFPTDSEPMQAVISAIEQAEREPDVLAVSLFHGFYLADHPDVGATVVVITDRRPELGRSIADRLAQQFSAAAIAIPQQQLSVEQALEQATFAGSFPVVIADRADNAGAGAASDSTFVLKAVLERKLKGVAMALFWDPVAVELAATSGPGAKIPLRIGGKVGPLSGEPVDLVVEVLSVRDDIRQAWFGVGEPRLPIGRSVAVRSGEVTIVLASERMQVFSRHVFTGHGIDPEAQRLLIVKSTQHFYGDFAPIARQVLYCDAPGTATSDMSSLSYTRIPRPIWPLDQHAPAPGRLLYQGPAQKRVGL